jgi:hypothetical protein
MGKKNCPERSKIQGKPGIVEASNQPSIVSQSEGWIHIQNNRQ